MGTPLGGLGQLAGCDSCSSFCNLPSEGCVLSLLPFNISSRARAKNTDGDGNFIDVKNL